MKNRYPKIGKYYPSKSRETIAHVYKINNGIIYYNTYEGQFSCPPCNFWDNFK